MSQAFDYFAASMSVISIERTQGQAGDVCYFSGSSNRWGWKESGSGKCSTETFQDREGAMTNAKAVLGRC